MRKITIIICVIFCFSLTHCSHTSNSVDASVAADVADTAEDVDSGDLPLGDSGPDDITAKDSAEDCGDSSPADQEPVGC